MGQEGMPRSHNTSMNGIRVSWTSFTAVCSLRILLHEILLFFRAAGPNAAVCQNFECKPWEEGHFLFPVG